MTSSSQPRRRISTVRFCDPVAPRSEAISSQNATTVLLATLLAAAIAVGLLALTVSAAQAMQ